MLVFLYRLVCGYLYVRVTSNHPEKLLNLCAAKGINIWRVLLKKDKLYFKIGIASFKRLRIYKRNISAKVHITKKVGLPFFIAKNKKRYGIAVGIALMFLMLNFMSGFVWNICISGNTSVSSLEILNSLKEIGIYEGVKISDIDPETKRNELLICQKQLSWAAINIEGSKLTVDVVETQKSDDKDTQPSNLKASEEGIVKRVEVKSGVLNVKPGDAVENGQLLVSGINEYEDKTSSFTRSIGKIYVETEKEFLVSQKLEITEYLKTNKIEKRSVLSFFGVNLPLFFGEITGYYETNNIETNISSGSSYIPVKIINRNFYKLKKTKYKLSEKNANKRAMKILENKIKNYLGDGEIIKRNDECYLKNNELFIKCKIRCIKDVALEEKMRLDTRN